MPSEQVDATFGHLLESLGSGCPPHAGFALGVDRLSKCTGNHQSLIYKGGAFENIRVCSVCLAVGPERAPSIRDVIAFPKSYTGVEALSGAPSAVTKDVLSEFGLTKLRGGG